MNCLNRLIKYLLAFLLFFSIYLIPISVIAQSSSIEVTSVFDLADKEAQNGDIISNIEGVGLTRTTAAYDQRLFGIVQNDPVIVYRRLDNSGTPIARSGVAEVNVTTFNGDIQSGDYITSSEIPGKGQKADASGYVIGVALESFTSQDGQEYDYQPISNPSKIQKLKTGQIQVALKIEYAEITRTRFLSGLLNIINTALFKNLEDPNKFVQLFKYTSAGLVILVSFIIGFLSFSRSIPKSIEAIGRNPLAQRAIHFSIILNIVLTIITALLGIGAALLILRL
ncbi:hypothetical protein M1563_05290 [Patescibacteria group bacterium]|nr:hypothetical protein [Patescibacteria group bacterium]MCL5409306.1 hypothetical protein [Patescibacteria group bacterium]